MTRQHSIDGFVPRRTRRPSHNNFNENIGEARGDKGLYRPVSQPRILQKSDLGIAQSDISESLKNIDSDKRNESDKKRRKKNAPKSKTRRIVKWMAILLLIAGLCVGGWLAYKVFHAGSNIFKGNILGLIQNQPLKEDANGRSNILVLGTSDDDTGHQGANLTDSMMIVSIDQKNKNAFMISIPRDLWVTYGIGCDSGNRGKINVYYSCVGGGNGNVDADRAALAKTSKFVGGIFGLEIQYGVNVNYTVMRQLVKAVDGITVTIESRDPRGQMDSNFDWKCGVGDRKVSRAEVLRRCPPRGHYIDYSNGPVYLDAEHALYLAQARGDAAPTYGFEQSNFDREKNQQKIVKAIRQKAVSTGVVTNFGKVSDILDALGTNLRTTFESSEVRTLASLAGDIQDKEIQSISLIDGDQAVMTTGMVGEQSVVEPAAGTYNYSALQALIKQKLSNNPVTRENASIVVLNGSGVTGVGQTQANKLKNEGFTISIVDTAPSGRYGDVEVYQIGSGMAATRSKIESLFNVKVKTTTPPVAVASGVNFVVIFGKDPTASSQ